MRVTIAPGNISGALSTPPSKSMAHRALICAALAAGESHIMNLSGSEDIAATCRALSLLGAKFIPEGENGMRVIGTGGQVAAPEGSVDCGESGSTLRFLIPVFARCGSLLYQSLCKLRYPGLYRCCGLSNLPMPCKAYC